MSDAGSYRILFVCSTNFCRSPLAAALFNAAAPMASLSRSVIADSAGTFPGIAPRPPDKAALVYSLSKGIDLSAHRSREIGEQDFVCEKLIALDQDSYWQLKRIAPSKEAAAKIERFVDYFGDLSLTDIPDPVLGQSKPEETFHLLEKGVEALLTRLSKQLEAD